MYDSYSSWIVEVCCPRRVFTLTPASVGRVICAPGFSASRCISYLPPAHRGLFRPSLYPFVSVFGYISLPRSYYRKYEGIKSEKVREAIEERKRAGSRCTLSAKHGLSRHSIEGYRVPHTAKYPPLCDSLSSFAFLLIASLFFFIFFLTVHAIFLLITCNAFETDD